ncbi:MAG TPA: TetR/AcrR family transcriptional regulator [Pseudonocardiaceae bacterium]|nr:TetR/AcrR family transcriptional regulator [Pseudonocardiaceae bacterium]
MTDAGRPGRRRSAQAHDAILDATIELLHEVGYSGLTIEGVAVRARVGKTTVYRWWSTKTSLVIEALDRYLDAPPLLPSDDCRVDVRALVHRIADTFARPPLGEVLPALAVDLTRDPQAAQQFRRMLAPRRAANAAVLYHAAGSGGLPRDIDPHALLDILAGAILYRCLMRAAPTPVLIDQLTDLVLEGRLPRLPADSK